MQELIQQLQEKAGLNPEQAAKAIDVVRDFVKSKVPPFIGDTVDKWFSDMGSPAKQKEAENDDFLDG